MSARDWENVHRSGAIATCPTAADGGYDLEVRDAWVQFFSTLADGARLLDVGTGNGAVALIARDTAASLGVAWAIHGTDLATTDPLRVVPEGARRLSGITFHPGVATERLPFDDGHFDAVSGHYALEYTDMPRALAEVHRVLRAGGDAQFVLHHADSVLARSARISVREGELVFNDTKIFRRLQRLVAMEQIVPQTTQSVADELREAIRTVRAAREVALRAGGGRVLGVALDSVQKLLEARKQVNAQAVALDVDRAERSLRESVARMRDLLDHALTDAQMDALQQQAADAGFSLIERLPLYHAGSSLVGWQLVMHRA